MADIVTEIRTHLLADATIAGLVGTRIEADGLSQDRDMPAIALWIISETPHEHLDGIVDTAQARFQVDCYAKTRGEASELGAAVRLKMTKYRGTPSTIYIRSINQASGQRHTFDEVEPGSAVRRYVHSQDFFVSYQVATS